METQQEPRVIEWSTLLLVLERCRGGKVSLIEEISKLCEAQAILQNKQEDGVHKINVL